MYANLRRALTIPHLSQDSMLNTGSVHSHFSKYDLCLRRLQTVVRLSAKKREAATMKGLSRSITYRGVIFPPRVDRITMSNEDTMGLSVEEYYNIFNMIRDDHEEFNYIAPLHFETSRGIYESRSGECE